jgi:hypothetical protein
MCESIEQWNKERREFWVRVWGETSHFEMLTAEKLAERRAEHANLSVAQWEKSFPRPGKPDLERATLILQRLGYLGSGQRLSVEDAAIARAYTVAARNEAELELLLCSAFGLNAPRQQGIR